MRQVSVTDYDYRSLLVSGQILIRKEGERTQQIGHCVDHMFVELIQLQRPHVLHVIEQGTVDSVQRVVDELLELTHANIATYFMGICGTAKGGIYLKSHEFASQWEGPCDIRAIALEITPCVDEHEVIAIKWLEKLGEIGIEKPRASLPDLPQCNVLCSR